MRLFPVSCCIAFFSAVALAGTKVQTVELVLDADWRIRQETRDERTVVLGLSDDTRYVQFFASPREEKKELGFTGGRAVTERIERWHGIDWRVRESSYVAPEENGRFHRATIVFETEHLGGAYVGYVSAEDIDGARDTVSTFLRQIYPLPLRSLSSDVYFGKKYYLGFGDWLSGFMGNEVKYDIAHTHDIFTTDIGGNYIGTKIHGSNQGASQIRAHWRTLQQDMLWNDMYVQYSSGHGYESGLAIGVTYDEIRDAVLAMPAKEIVVFTMACHSGGLVNSFNRKKTVWEQWGQYDKTLFVMASSRVDQLSSTGPGNDSEEPGGPYGSAGSAFGHALWKALIGHADGHGNGVKDGMISLGEIIDFTTWKTKMVGGHDPVHTGVFNRNLIMNRSPKGRELAAFTGGTEGLNDEQIAAKIRELDAAFRLR